MTPPSLLFGQALRPGTLSRQTIGLPILCRIPVLKYLFSTVTTIKERTYIVVSAEATIVDINSKEEAFNNDSAATAIKRRIENPFRSDEEEEKK